jgi:ferredoxin
MAGILKSTRGSAWIMSLCGRVWLWLGLAVLTTTLALAEQRFPPPDFETGHQIPTTTTPPARAWLLEYLDIAVLTACLGVATWLIYRRRSRKGLIGLSIFSVAYFGFYRQGCICAIGSVQNVALALFDTGYALPVSALVFFLLPLAFALFAGRSFCAGVCPHGALQDLVLLKPLKIPLWLEHGLSVLPFVYLGAGVLFAATGSAFIICQYDPFVPIFRLSGRSLMVLTGAALLLLGIFVGRPYCRFLCPYGALLKIAGAVSKLRVRVTPDYCTQCRLCEASCPFGAMRLPEAQPLRDAKGLIRDRRRLALAIGLLPLLILLGGWLGNRFSGPASLLNPTVSLAERFVREKDAAIKLGTLSADDLALDRVRQAPRELLLDANRIRRQFQVGTLFFGGWIGLVIGAKFISLALRRQRTDYEPDRGACVACARCFEYCPNELVRRGVMRPEDLPLPGAGPQAIANPAGTMMQAGK